MGVIMGLGFTNKVVLEQFLKMAEEMADKIQEQAKSKQTRRSQQATSCEAVATSMGQGQNVQPQQTTAPADTNNKQSALS